jgi:16S rRNA G966 N2-methylase RsmD
MLTTEEQVFIQENLKKDTVRLVLEHHKYPDLDIKKLANQINIRKKATSKLPTWSNNDAIFFPSTISWQQCSSEYTAKYKAQLLKGKTIIDLTGGFGVDVFFFAQMFEVVTYVERDTELSEIVAYNYKVLNQKNIKIMNQDSLGFIENHKPVDVIYLDPARRDAQQQKIITLEDSTPNILEIQEMLLSKANYILLKTSPMLDIHKAIKDLKKVESVHVVAVENECKELIFVLNKNADANINLTCVNIQRDGKMDISEAKWEESINLEYSMPNSYMYDPNKAIHKGGIFNKVGRDFDVKKLSANTHLYTSEKLVADFQGRIFQLEKILKPQKKEIQKYLINGKANLITRNFPESVANLKKKWTINDGGNTYLLAVTLENAQKVVLLCKKIDID